MTQQCSLLNERSMFCHQNPIIGYQKSLKYNYYITYEQQGIIIAWDYNQNYPLKQQDLSIKNIQYAKIFDSDDSFLVYSSDGKVSFFNLWDFSFKNSTSMPNQNQVALNHLESLGYLAYINVLSYQLTLQSTWKGQKVQKIVLDLSSFLSSNNKVFFFDSISQVDEPAFILNTGDIYLINLETQNYRLLDKIILKEGDKVKDAKQINGNLLFVLSNLGNVFLCKIKQSQGIIQLNSDQDQNQQIQSIKLSYLSYDLINQNLVYLIGKTHIYYVEANDPTLIRTFEIFNNQNKKQIKQIDIYQQLAVYISEENEIFVFSNQILKKNNYFTYSNKNQIHFTSSDTLNFAVYFDNPSIGLVIFDTNDIIHQIYQCFNPDPIKDIYGVTIPTLIQQIQFQYGPYLNYDSKNQLILKYYQNTLSCYNIFTRKFLYTKIFNQLVNIQLNNLNIISGVILSQNTVLSIDYFTGQIISQYKFPCSVKEMISLSFKPTIIVTNSFQKQTGIFFILFSFYQNQNLLFQKQDINCESQIAMVDLSTQNYQQLDEMFPEIKSQSLLRIGISEQQDIVIDSKTVKRDILVAGTNVSIFKYYCQWIQNQASQNSQYSCSLNQTISLNSVDKAAQIEFDMVLFVSFVLFSNSNTFLAFSLNKPSSNLLKQSQFDFQIHSFIVVQQSNGIIFFTQPPRTEIFFTKNSYAMFYTKIVSDQQYENFPQIFTLDNNFKKTAQFFCLSYVTCVRQSFIIQSDGMFTYSSQNSIIRFLVDKYSPQKEEDSITELYSSIYENVMFFSQKSKNLNIIFDTPTQILNLVYNTPYNFVKIMEQEQKKILILTQENLEINISSNQQRNILKLNYLTDFTISNYDAIDSFNAFIFDEEIQTVSRDYQNCWIVGSSEENQQQLAYIENFQIKLNVGFTYKDQLLRVMKFNNFILIITNSSTDPQWTTQVYFNKIQIDSVTQQINLQQFADLQNLSLATDVIYDQLTQRIYFYSTSKNQMKSLIYYILYQDIQLVLKGDLKNSQLKYEYVPQDIMKFIKLNIINIFFYQCVNDERNTHQLNQDESSSILIIVTFREILTVAQKLDPKSTQIFRVLNYLNSQYQILRTVISAPLKAIIIFPALQRTLEIRSVVKQNQAVYLNSKDNLFYSVIYFVDEEQHSRFILCSSKGCQYFKLEKIKKDQQQISENDFEDNQTSNNNQKNTQTNRFLDQIDIQAQLLKQESSAIDSTYQIVQILSYTQPSVVVSLQNIPIYNLFIEALQYQVALNIRDYETGKVIRAVDLRNVASVGMMYNKYLNNLHVLGQDSLIMMDLSEIMTYNSQTITESISPTFNIINCYHKMKYSGQSIVNQSYYYLIGSQNGIILKQDFEQDVFQIELSIESEILGSFTFKGQKYFYSQGVIIKVTQTESNKDIYQKYLNFNNQGYKILKEKQENSQNQNDNEYLIGISYPLTIKVYNLQNDNIVLLKELKLQNNILNISGDNQVYEQQAIIADISGNLYLIYLDGQKNVQMSYTSIISDQSTFIQSSIIDQELKLIIVYDSKSLISFYSLQDNYTLQKITKFSYSQNQLNKKIFYDEQNHLLIYRSSKIPSFIAIKIESLDSQKIISSIEMVNFSKDTPELKISKLNDGVQYLIIIQQNFIQVHEYYKTVDQKTTFPMVMSLQNSLHLVSSAQIIQYQMSEQLLLLIITYEDSLEIYKFNKFLSNFIHSNNYMRDKSPQLFFQKQFNFPNLLTNYLQYSTSDQAKGSSVQASETLTLLGYSQNGFFKLDLMLESDNIQTKQCQIDIYQTSYLSLSNIFNMYQTGLISIANSASTKYQVTIYLQDSNQLSIIPEFPSFKDYNFVIKAINSNQEYSIQNPPQVNLQLTDKLVQSIQQLSNVKFQQLFIQISQSESELLFFSKNLKFVQFDQCFWKFLEQDKNIKQNLLFKSKTNLNSQQDQYTFNNIQYLINFQNVTNIIFNKNIILESQIQQHIFSVEGKNSQLQMIETIFYKNTILGQNCLIVRENAKVDMQKVSFESNQLILNDFDLINNQFPPILLFLGISEFNSLNLTMMSNNLSFESENTLTSENAIPSFIYAIQCFACDSVNLQTTNFGNNENILFYQQKNSYQIYNEEQDIVINIKTDLPKFNSTLTNLQDNNIAVQFSTIIAQEYGGFIYLEQSLVQIKDSLFKNNQYTIKFNSNELYLYVKKMFSVITLKQSYSILIDNSEFLKNQMINGGALYIEECLNQIIINNNKIIDNQAQINGGAIVLIRYTNIDDYTATLNTITGNIAQISGGALHLESTTIRMKDNDIQNNSASIVGGGIRYMNIVPQFIKEQNQFYFRNLEYASIEYGKDRFNNTIQNNKAKIFGNNIASYSKYVSLIYNYTIIDKNQPISYKISSVQSGKSISDLQIFLHDEEGNMIDLSKASNDDLIRAQIDEVVNEIINSKASAFIAQNSTNLLELDEVTEFSFTKNGYNFSSMEVVGIPGSQEPSYLQIYDIPLYTSYLEGDTNFINISSTPIQVELNFRECQKGEVQVNSTKNYLFKCSVCPLGKYQLKDPNFLALSDQVCLPCPLEKANQCYANQIELKKGYWRKNNETDEIIQCEPNTLFCNGDPKTNYCSEGRIGPLCETCDIFGEVWKQSYFHSSIKTCSKCHSFDIHAYLNIFLMIMIFFYIIIVVRGIILKAESQIYTTYLRKTGLFIAGTSAEADQSTIYIKMLITYLFISTSFFSFNLLFPLEVISLTSSVSNPIKVSYFSADCFLKDFRKSSPLPYTRMIILQIAPLIFFALITAFFYILQRFFFKQRFNKKYLYASISTIFILFHGSISQSLFELISCRTIGSDKYVQIYLTKQCYDDDHRFYSLTLGLPLIIIWVFIIPISILFYMRSQKTKLDSFQNLYRFGSITQEYKRKVYYWEIVRVYLRIIISFLVSFFLSNSMFKGISVLIIILIYWIMLSKYQPYIQKSLNKRDKNVCMVEMIIIISCTFIDNTSFSTLKMAFSIIVYILHAYQTISLIYFIIYSYYHKNLTKFIQVINKIVSKINCFFSKEVRESLRYSSLIHKYSRFKHWQFLRLNVHQAILYRKSNPKHKMLSAQTVRISQVNHVRKIRSQLNFLLSNPDNSKSYVQIDTPFQRDSSASHQTQNFDDLKIKKMQSILQDRQGLAFHSPQNREQNPKILQKIPLQSQFSKINAPLRYITDVSSSNLSNNNQNTYSDKSCFVQESQIILENNTYRIYQTKEVNNYLPQVLTSYQVTNFPTVRPLNENSSKADALESNQTNLNFSFTENQEQGQPTQIRLQSGYIQTAGNLQTNGQLNYTHKTLEEQVFITYDDIEGKANFNYVEQGIDQLISIKRNQNYKNKQKQE